MFVSMRLYCALLTFALALSSGAQPVSLTRDHWTFAQLYARDKPLDSARFETYMGRPALVVPSGFGFVNDASFTNGTLEADFALYPKARFFGLAFHVAYPPDRYEIVFFRPQQFPPTIQYTPSFDHMNAWQFFPYPDYAAIPDYPQDRWFHLKIVVRGLDASIYLDTATTPTLEIHDLALGGVGGTIGIWGRNGGAYVSNIRITPDTTSYPLTHTRTFEPGAITTGWSLSDAFPVTETDPGTYPNIVSLKWQPVEAEREGIVLIGRYRRDPNVEGPRPLRDSIARPSPGTQVVFARNVITSPRDVVRKMWIGYSDDVVVYLNGRPLYAGRNSMTFRDPSALGFFYPYADAVYLPLKRGKNELVLAVSETTAGWGFMTRFDPP